VLNVDELVAGISANGDCSHCPTLRSSLTSFACDGDVVAIMSNGGFGGIHEKLLEALASTAKCSRLHIRPIAVTLLMATCGKNFLA
jgi:UDP-N-acetylmuramate: L-alanyl-gamma-D-glutamyl-meso-diaminopimelate ligase